MRITLPRLIGITGKAGAGKDTLADYLVRQHGFSKYSLAAPMKKLLNERFGWTDEDWSDREWKEAPIPACGYERGALGFMSPRSWAQWLGTEVGRTIGGENVWVNMMAREWDRLHVAAEVRRRAMPLMVVPDVRFDNEAARILALGGVVIRVVRPGAVPVAAHVSETGVQDELVQLSINNDTDIITFLQQCVAGLELVPRGV